MAQNNSTNLEKSLNYSQLLGNIVIDRCPETQIINIYSQEEGMYRYVCVLCVS